MKIILGTFATTAGLLAGSLATHAQTLADYPNLSVTTTLSMGNNMLGLMYAQLNAYAPFLIQIMWVFIVIGAVWGLFYFIWSKIRSIGGGSSK